MGTFIDDIWWVNSNKEQIQSTEMQQGQPPPRSLINLKHPDCSTGQGSSLGYGEVAHVGRSWGVSMLDQVTGKCCGCHKLLGPQISSQICPRIPSIAEWFTKKIHDQLVKHMVRNLEKLAYGNRIYHVFWRKSFLTNHSFHGLYILSNGIVCI